MTKEEAWQDLKETIIELRDNDGVGTQQGICKFLANLMNVLEKQIQESERLLKEEFTRKAEEVLLNVDFIEGIPLFNSKDFDDYEISDGEGSMMLTDFLDDFYRLLFESQESEV